MSKELARGGLEVSITQLRKLADDLEKEYIETFPDYKKLNKEFRDNSWQITIINKTPEFNDTWELERNNE